MPISCDATRSFSKPLEEIFPRSSRCPSLCWRATSKAIPPHGTSDQPWVLTLAGKRPLQSVEDDHDLAVAQPRVGEILDRTALAGERAEEKLQPSSGWVRRKAPTCRSGNTTGRRPTRRALASRAPASLLRPGRAHRAAPGSAAQWALLAPESCFTKPSQSPGDGPRSGLGSLRRTKGQHLGGQDVCHLPLCPPPEKATQHPGLPSETAAAHGPL
jgi:hypothetical protein